MDRLWYTAQQQKGTNHSITWMNLKTVRPSETLQIQTAACYIFPFIQKARQGNALVTEIPVVGWGQGGGGINSFQGKGIVLYLDCGRGYMIV